MNKIVSAIGDNSSLHLKRSKRRRNILPFILLSLLFHLILLFLYLLLYAPEQRAQKPEEKPEFIEITEIPVPKEKETEPPEEVKRFAERSRRAPEEKTRDDFTREGAVSTLPQTKTPARPRTTERKTEPVERSKEIKTAERQPKKEASSDIPRVEEDSELRRKEIEERRTPDLSKEDLFSSLPREFSGQEQGSREYLGSPNVDKKEDTVDLSTTEYRYLSYFLKLKRQIEGVWTYPEMSRLRGEQGQLFLVFTLTRDGRLEDVQLIDSSGFNRLDDEAVRAIRVASPFSPFPDSWNLERLNIRAVFKYQISYGWTIR